nr:serine/threonine-protein kinase [Kineosporia mesophila]
MVEMIGAGGMGQVWRGFDAVLDREVAIKLIRKDVIAGPEQIADFHHRFQREARVTARIRHHGIPQVYDALLDPSGGDVYLVMELVTGVPLRRFIDPSRPLPLSWVTAVVAQICTSLSHAHAIPVVHRDLKPENVMVGADGGIKLLDFGIAALLETGVTRITSSGQPLGTSHYMPPEQVKGGKIAPYSDLYALGCLTHELLSGGYVFQATNDFERMQKHVDEAPPPLRSLRNDVPAEIEDLVLRLLAKDPDARPESAFDVYEELLPFLPQPGTNAEMVQPTAGSGGLTRMPDPTLLFRRPNAPQRPTSVVEPTTGIAPLTPGLPTAPGSVPDPLAEELRLGETQALKLAEAGRIEQAAQVLDGLIRRATTILNAGSFVVAELRRSRAGYLMLGEDYGRALPELVELADRYGRRRGSEDDFVRGCLMAAAECLAALGRTSEALVVFREVLDVLAAESDVSDDAVEVRLIIGVLLITEGSTDEALQALDSLSDDLEIIAPDSAVLEEVRAHGARLRATGHGG